MRCVANATQANLRRAAPAAAKISSLRNVTAALLPLDRAGRVTQASAGAENLFNGPARSLMGVPAARVIPEIDLARLAANLRPAKKGRRTSRTRDVNQQDAARRGDTTDSMLRDVLVPAGESGRKAGVTAAFLRKEMRRLAAIVQEAEDGILTVGADFKIALFNRSAEKMFGYAAAEAVGRPLNLLIPARFHARHDGHLRQFGASPETVRRMGQRSEITARRKNGEEFPADISIVKLDVEGETAFVAILRDITAHKREAEALWLAKTQAEAASRAAKSEFLANMSHELRTPLNAIIGFSEMILTQPQGPIGHPAYEEYLHYIVESGTHLLSLINNVLDMSKIEAGKARLNLAEIEIGGTIGSAVRIMGEQAAAAGLRLVEKTDAQLPSLLADERLVKQMLLNLISNAIKFTPKGGRVTIGAGMEADGSLAVRVTDSGIGMDAKDIPKALEPFGQIDSSLTRQHCGTGLGLPLVKSMIELHGGALSIESRKAAGTTVILKFPPARVKRSKDAGRAGARTSAVAGPAQAGFARPDYSV
jgi:PAS domain S-box-containing protein